MSNITSLQYKTEIILNKFFEDIAKVKLTDTNQRLQLLKRTKGLFKALDNLKIEEFAKIFEYNYFNNNVSEEYEKYQIALKFLVACIIERYSQSDLLRYFLPEHLSQKENRPEYSSYLSKVQHWFRLIGYWLRQLVNKPKYEYTIENNQFADSVQAIKTALSKKPYLENMADGNFEVLLMGVIIKIEEKVLVAVNESERINDREKELARQEDEFSKKERLFNEKLNSLENAEINFRERSELLTQENQEIEKQKKGFEDKIKELTESIVDLKKTKFEEKTYTKYLEDHNFNYEEGIKELIKEAGITTPQISRRTSESTQKEESLYDSCVSLVVKSPEQLKEESLPGSCVSLSGRLGQSDQPIQTNPKLSRSRSCSSLFFDEHLSLEVIDATNSSFKVKVS